VRTLHFAATAIALGTIAFAQEGSAPGVPVQMVITAEARHGKEAPSLHAQDVMAFHKDQRLPVTDLIPCQGKHAALELFLLIDDASSTILGSQLNDLKHFIETQPASASIGVAYMQNATVKIAQNPTTDHASAAKALRLPFGYPGVSPSPFLSLSDLIKRWPAGAARSRLDKQRDRSAGRR